MVGFYLKTDAPHGTNEKVIDRAYDRFGSAFGPLNYLILYGDYAIVVIDSVSLTAPKETRYFESAYAFLQNVSKQCKFLPYKYVMHY